MRYMVTGWNNANGKLVPIEAELNISTTDKKEIIEKGKELLVRQINDELGDHWLHDVKFWQIGGVTWQLVDDLNDLISKHHWK